MIQNLPAEEIQYVSIVRMCPYVPARWIPFFLRYHLAEKQIQISLST